MPASSTLGSSSAVVRRVQRSLLRAASSRACITCALWLSLALFVLPWAASAQPARTYVWLQSGPTLTTLGPGVHAIVGVAFDRHVLALRGASTDFTPDGETWDVGLLYGRTLTMGRLHLWGGTGVAVVGGTRYRRLFGGDDGEPFDPIIGFPLEANVAWLPTAVLAVGLHAFADVNTEHPFGGIGVHVRVGRLR